MARSSIQGTSPAPAQPAGRDTASLGPGDTSDSGSDMMGIVDSDSDGGDPNAPADVASRDDQSHSLLSPDGLNSPSDAAGTGESRSAGADGGKQDGWDIGVDQVFTPDGTDTTAEEDPDLAFMDNAEAGDPLSEEEVDEGEGDDAAPPKPTSPALPKKT